MIKYFVFTIDDTEKIANQFCVEYAKSNRSTCQGCQTKIEKDSIRLSRKVFTSKEYGPTDQWYHIDCFKEHKEDLNFDGNAET